MGLKGRFLWLIQGVVDMGAIAFTLLLTSAVCASENVNTKERVPSLPQLTGNQPATTVADWLAQIEASVVQITNVRVEATEEGLQVCWKQQTVLWKCQKLGLWAMI